MAVPPSTAASASADAGAAALRSTDREERVIAIMCKLLKEETASTVLAWLQCFPAPVNRS
jgi:hypothetical protein